MHALENHTDTARGRCMSICVTGIKKLWISYTMDVDQAINEEQLREILKYAFKCLINFQNILSGCRRKRV